MPNCCVRSERRKKYFRDGAASVIAPRADGTNVWAAPRFYVLVPGMRRLLQIHKALLRRSSPGLHLLINFAPEVDESTQVAQRDAHR
jgi:hypothetical protein